MRNIIILYNPYYEKNVIELHLEILKETGVVAFGKIKSKLRDYELSTENNLEEIYQTVSKENPIQLFLTDYNSMYVANVISISEQQTKYKAPDYYEKLDVEKWFIFDDLRLLASNDFETIRDKILSNFKTINYNNHTYAIYGNKYVYPMQITMKEEINYFEKENEDFKYFTNIFKSDEQIIMKQNLINFTFGEKKFYSLSPDTQDNIINAEVEYHQNKQNPLYDYGTVVVKYSKAVELELYKFMILVFENLINLDKSIANFAYQIQGIDYILKDIIKRKPNFGTYKYIIKADEIKNSINANIVNSRLRVFIFQDLIYYIGLLQKIRNESVHGSITSKDECDEIRKNILGIGKSGMLNELIRNKKHLSKDELVC